MEPMTGFEPKPKPRVNAGFHLSGNTGWRMFLGMLIVGWGLLLTADLNGSDLADDILDHWYFPGAMTALGLYRVLTAESGLGRGVGGGIAILGGWWLVAETYGFRFSIWHWWPLGLVAFGVLTIVRAMADRTSTVAASELPAGLSPSVDPLNVGWQAAAGGSDQPSTPAPGPAPASMDAGPISAFAFWSGVHKRVSAAFKRADLAAVMGGIELDLRPAVTVGGRATIDVFVIMGGLEITVPPDWTVTNEAVVIMGGIEDRSSGSPGARQTLVIRGLILMGGVEIKT